MGFNFGNIVPNVLGNLENRAVGYVENAASSKLAGALKLKKLTPAARLSQTDSPLSVNSYPDWRIAISLPPSSPLLPLMKKGTPMSHLSQDGKTGKFIFPITPQIATSDKAKYETQSLTHSNFDMVFYEGSEVSSITLAGDFPVQNDADAHYYLSGIYFFRTLTKMFWGKDVHAGSPPSLVYLTGLGRSYFPTVPCVVTSFDHSIANDVDYYKFTDSGNNTEYAPTLSTFSVTLQPVYSRRKVRQFSLSDFAEGKLITRGFM